MTTPNPGKITITKNLPCGLFVMSTGFLSVASWKEYNRSTSSSERMPLREKLTAGFSSFLLQTHKGWGDVLAGEKENPSV